MGLINKGTVASISGNTARVVPSDAGTKPTIMITIPWHLRGEAGDLKKGTAVAYVEFDDFTGLLLGRIDGEGGAGAGGGGSDGEDGATFTPAVSPAGDLSWSNDKGLENPETVNIMGPQGLQGEKGDTGDTGPQGPQGEPGADAPVDTYLPLAGGTMTGPLTVNGSAEFNGDVYGTVYGLGCLTAVPENADFNNYLQPGAYAVRGNAVAATVSNIPTQNAGRLFVSSSTGGGYSENDAYVYLEQKFLPYTYGNQTAYGFVRYVSKDGTPDFQYTPWINEALKAYPVGSIYLAYGHTSPASLFGGTWTRIENSFLWACDGNGQIGNTGGESSHILTVNEMPSHNHQGITWGGGAPISFNGGSNNGYYVGYGVGLADSGSLFHTNYRGGGAAHNNMPPFIQISAWRRTA